MVNSYWVPSQVPLKLRLRLKGTSLTGAVVHILPLIKKIWHIHATIYQDLAVLGLVNSVMTMACLVLERVQLDNCHPCQTGLMLISTCEQQLSTK